MAIGRTFPRVAAKGAAVAGDRAGPASTADPAEAALRHHERRGAGGPGVAWPRRTGSSSWRRRCAGASRSTRSPRARGIDPWFLDQMSRICDERSRLAALGDAGRALSPPATGGGPSGSGSPTPSWPTCWGTSEADVRAARLALGRAGDLQDGRHLRGRVRGLHAVPLLDLRGRGRGRPSARARVVILGLGPEPHRPGDRVRLLLRPRLLGAARRRLRDRHGQLQPRDGLDRLRHLATGSTSSR